jgi:hypothetical protein
MKMLRYNEAGKGERWERVAALSLKPSQPILNITASCNKRMSRVSTLNTSSMKSFWKRRPSLGVISKGITKDSSSYITPTHEYIFTDFFERIVLN